MAGAKLYETDITIIGSGGAGMAAGIEARDAGAQAVAFEQSAELGGAAIISGGGCLIVGTPLQKENGIHDTPDLAFNDWMKWGGPSADEVWARYYIEHSLHDLYHWAEGLGVKWVDMKFQEGNTVMRWTRAERNGLGLTTHLIDAFRERGGEIVPNTEITKLKVENGRVTGVEGRDAETGAMVDVTSKTVLVATGGFNSNLDMVIEARPDLKNERVMEGSGRGSTGSGHKLVRQVDGYLTHVDHIWFYVYATKILACEWEDLNRIVRRGVELLRQLERFPELRLFLESLVESLVVALYGVQECRHVHLDLFGQLLQRVGLFDEGGILEKLLDLLP